MRVFFLLESKISQLVKIKTNNKFDADNFGQYIYARKFNAEFYDEMERSLQGLLDKWLDNINKNK